MNAKSLLFIAHVAPFMVCRPPQRVNAHIGSLEQFPVEVQETRKQFQLENVLKVKRKLDQEEGSRKAIPFS